LPVRRAGELAECVAQVPLCVRDRSGMFLDCGKLHLQGAPLSALGLVPGTGEALLLGLLRGLDRHDQKIDAALSGFDLSAKLVARRGIVGQCKLYRLRPVTYLGDGKIVLRSGKAAADLFKVRLREAHENSRRGS
jgi:hypothetical protein